MLIGQWLRNRYEILEQLGEGAFGETYKARDQERPSKPFCVVKRLKPAHTNQLVRDFFDNEAAVLEKLGEHPHIPRLLAHFMLGQELFIVQEFVEGHSLRREIQPGKRLSESYATKLVQDVLETLAFVHENGVIHRDIKPENVMRRQQDGKLVLIDFGVVKELGSVVVNSVGSVQTSVVAGTPGYMPIEQFRGKPGFYSDVYAVGVMAIESLTGLYSTALPRDQTGKILWRDRVLVSDRFADFLDTMVREFCDKRYQSAAEALKALQPIINPLSVPAPAPASVPVPLVSTYYSSPPPSSSPSSPPSSSSPPIASPAPDYFPSPVALPTPSAPALDWSRRKLLKTAGWLSLGAGGVSVIALGQRFFRSTDTPRPSSSLPPLQSFSFETVTVNASGAVIDRRSGQAQFFAEDLGNGVMLEMVQIPGGTFRMGSPESEKDRGGDESPQHQVTVPSFFMGKFAVTQAQYEAIVGSNPSNFQGANRPVEQVSWNDAIEFCDKLSQRTGRTYRLPSEAEREYACRAGTTTPFHFGATITSELANYRGTEVYQSEPAGEYRQQTTDVGSFPPNAFGLYDMHGNVLEWCQDVWHDNYFGAPTDGSAWTTGGEETLRLLRGGSWLSFPKYCRSAFRNWLLPDIRVSYYGFRVVLVARTS